MPACACGGACRARRGGLFASLEITPPKEPITINLNIKLDADVRLRVEEEAEDDVNSKDIF